MAGAALLLLLLAGATKEEDSIVAVSKLLAMSWCPGEEERGVVRSRVTATLKQLSFPDIAGLFQLDSADGARVIMLLVEYRAVSGQCVTRGARLERERGTERERGVSRR
jgi:hypothetical protein